MNRLDILIAVVAIGFLACWLSLRRIENYLHQCLLKLIDLDSTADNVKDLTEQSSTMLDNIWEHFEERFPLPEERDDPYPPLPEA